MHLANSNILSICAKSQCKAPHQGKIMSNGNFSYSFFVACSNACLRLKSIHVSIKNKPAWRLNKINEQDNI